MLGVESLERAFGEHAHRRAAGTPTPVVLVGPPVIDGWITALNGAVARVTPQDADSSIAAYLADPLVRQALGEELERRAFAIRGAPAAEQTWTERELWTSVTGDALLAAGDIDGQLLLEHVVRGEAAPPVRVFAAAIRVLRARAPGLLISTELDAGVRIAIALAEVAPRLAIAVAATAEAWVAWTSIPGREHAKAIVRACLSPIEEARALAAEARRSRSAQADDAARSAAERALFEALESHSASRGLFLLNHELDVRFGPRKLEIDLACPSLRIAVEVDGYFHFQDSEAYRRDRRKDIALQREAYFVVRVLAEDVVTQLAETVAAVHETIAFRQGLTPLEPVISEGKSR